MTRQPLKHSLRYFLTSGVCFLVLLLTGFSPDIVFAIGGSDEEPLTKINRATRQCQQSIAREGKRYAAKRAKAIGQCLNAFIKCDERRTEEKAQACRGKLLAEGTGACAEEGLDSGITTLGVGAANAALADPDATERLNRALLNFIAAVDDQCFQDDDVDLASTDTGLGFTEDPQSASQLVDLLNRVPNGVGCLGNELVWTSHPLNQEILAQLLDFANTCVVNGEFGPGIGNFCLNNFDCGVGGKCGMLANAIAGGILPSCVQ